MSFRVVAKVFRESEETLARRLILLALAEAASDDGIAWLGQESIAEKARLSRTHVTERIKEMAADGVIEIRKAQRGRQRISVYRIILPGLDDPNYDRLPFALNEPFTVSEVLTSSSGDGVGSSAATVSDPPGSAPLIGEPSLETVKDLPPRPPSLVKVDGRNLAMDALAEECGIIEGDPRYGEVIAALNGKRGGPPGIRALFWADCERYVDGHPEASGRLSDLAADPELFERALEAAVHAKARRYREVMGGAFLTPGALAKWWVSVESMQGSSPGLSPDEIRRLGAQL